MVEPDVGIVETATSGPFRGRCREKSDRSVPDLDAIGAEEAERLNIVDYLVGVGAGEAFMTGWVEKSILPHSASSLRLAQRACRMRVNRLLEEELPVMERLYLDELMETVPRDFE